MSVLKYRKLFAPTKKSLRARIYDAKTLEDLNKLEKIATDLPNASAKTRRQWAETINVARDRLTKVT